MTAVGMKTCGACRIEKPLASFCSRKRDGSSSICKPCGVIATRAWRAANPAGRKAEYAARVARRALAVAAFQRELEFAPAAQTSAQPMASPPAISRPR
jgi:hypothetical protein